MFEPFDIYLDRFDVQDLFFELIHCLQWNKISNADYNQKLNRIFPDIDHIEGNNYWMLLLNSINMTLSNLCSLLNSTRSKLFRLVNVLVPQRLHWMTFWISDDSVIQKKNPLTCVTESCSSFRDDSLILYEYYRRKKYIIFNYFQYLSDYFTNH